MDPRGRRVFHGVSLTQKVNAKTPMSSQHPSLTAAPPAVPPLGPVDATVLSLSLSVSEEAALLRHWRTKLGELCVYFGAPPKVLGTALAFLGRFYLSNSPMVFSPKLVMLASLFLAAKVEEYKAKNLKAESIALIVKGKGDGPDATDRLVREVVDAEISLLVGVKFQLVMYHPFHPLAALVDGWSRAVDAGTAVGGLAVKQEGGSAGDTLAANASGGAAVRAMLAPAMEAVRLLVLHDRITLLYAPADVALAALDLTASSMAADAAAHGGGAELREALWAFVGASIGAASDDAVAELRLRVGEIVVLKGEGGGVPEKSMIKAIDKKLKKVALWNRAAGSGGGVSAKKVKR